VAERQAEPSVAVARTIILRKIAASDAVKADRYTICEQHKSSAFNALQHLTITRVMLGARSQHYVIFAQYHPF
jgi:hypothetical protein